jgi:hypothetical protein
MRMIPTREIERLLTKANPWLRGLTGIAALVSPCGLSAP